MVCADCISCRRRRIRPVTAGRYRDSGGEDILLELSGVNWLPSVGLLSLPLELQASLSIQPGLPGSFSRGPGRLVSRRSPLSPSHSI